MKTTLLIILTLFSLSVQCEAAPASNESEAIDGYFQEIVSKIEKKLRQEENFTVIGVGGGLGFDGYLAKIEIAFNANKEGTLEEGRRLIIKAAGMLRDEINKHKGLKPYLKSYPASIDIAKMTIFFDTQRYPKRLNAHEITTISIIKGNITYRMHDEIHDRSVELSRETFSEAEKKVSQKAIKKPSILTQGRSLFEKAIDDLCKLVADRVAKEEKLQMIGYGGGGREQVEELRLHLKSKKEGTAAEGRRLALKISKLLQEEVAKDPKLKDKLIAKPFPIENIDVVIFFKERKPLQENVVDLVDMYKGKLEYRMKRKRCYMNFLSETYPEAQEKLAKGVTNCEAKEIQRLTNLKNIRGIKRKIIKQVADKLCKEEGVKIVNGVGSLNMRLYKITDIKEGRRLLVKTTTKILDLLNSEEKLIKLRKGKPFSVDELQIYFHIKKEIEEKSLCLAMLSGSEFVYKIHTPNGGTKIVLIETLEEAEEKLNQKKILK